MVAINESATFSIGLDLNQSLYNTQILIDRTYGCAKRLVLRDLFFNADHKENP